MKLLLIILLMATIINPSDILTKEFDEMSSEQRATLYRAYEYGEPYGLGYSMAAIAWRESKAGKWLVNMQDPSFGLWHNNLNTVLNRMNLLDNKFNRNIIASRLIMDEQFAASQALAELEYWKFVHGDKDWIKIWGSYNGGWNGNPEYALDIKRKIKVLIKNLKRKK